MPRFVFLSVVAFVCAIALNVSGQVALDLFHEWFQQRGGKSSHIQVKSFEDGNRGIECVDTLQEEGSLVLEVPMDMVLHIPSLSRENTVNPTHLSISQSFQNNSLDHALIAILLHEKILSNDSFWAPYIAVLPSLVRNGLHFTMEDMKEFQNPILVTKMQRMQKEIIDSFSVFQSVCLKNQLTTLKDTTFEDFRWATTIIDR